MNWKRILWSVTKAVFKLLWKITLLCVFLASSLTETILKNLNEYLKRNI